MHPAPYRNPLSPVTKAVLGVTAGVGVGLVLGTFAGRALQRRHVRRSFGVVRVGPSVPGREDMPEGAAVVVATEDSPGRTDFDPSPVLAVFPAQAGEQYPDVHPRAQAWADAYVRQLGDVRMGGHDPAEFYG